MREVFFFIKVWYFGGRCKLNSGEETMALAGIDLKSKVVETLVAVIAFVTVLYGPLWPVGRLALLNETDDKLAHDGIYNANAQRMFSWVALFSLVIAVALFVGGGYYGYRWYAASLFAGMLYVWLTCVVFEDSITDAIKRLGYILLAILAILVIALTIDKNSKVEPVKQGRKMMAGNIAGVVFMFMLAFVGVLVAVDKLGCWLLNWCH